MQEFLLKKIVFILAFNCLLNTFSTSLIRREISFGTDVGFLGSPVDAYIKVFFSFFFFIPTEIADYYLIIRLTNLQIIQLTNNERMISLPCRSRFHQFR